MRHLSIPVLAICSICGCVAQQPYRHAVSVEASGFILFRYDYMFPSTEAGFWDAGLSAGRYASNDPTYRQYEVRANGSYNFGRSKYFLEVGLTVLGDYRNYPNEVPAGVSKESTDLTAGPTLGARFIGKKGLMLRLYGAVTTGTDTYLLFGGGAGWCFGRKD
jgi:hypothetical protein